MADDFHKHLVVLVGRLVSGNDDLGTGEILQFVHLYRTMATAERQGSTTVINIRIELHNGAE